MTPKEKAIELRFRYWRCIDIDGIDSKRCALIAVDEIIKFGNEQGIREPMMYWNKVKEEIEKL
jgi:hypothetical protein